MQKAICGCWNIEMIPIEIDAHPLGEKEKDEILSEVELRPDISSCWNREMLPEIVPRLCWKYGVGQGMDMS